MKTTSSKHNELVGKKVTIDGWNAIISDTTETSDGQIYVAVTVKAISAMYLEHDWMKVEKLNL